MIKILKWLFSVDGSTVIYNLGLGIGAFLGGLAGLRYISEWLQKQRRQELIRNYQIKYPKELDGEQPGWELSHNPDRKGHLYLLDHRDQTRHWIANWGTFRDLFVNVPIYGDQRKDEVFKSYQQADHILTLG